jgi:hypothetical protein
MSGFRGSRLGMTSAHKVAMRTHSFAAVSFLIAAVGLTACAPAAEGDDAEGQESNVTGGSSSVESPVLFLFEAGGTRDSAPKCAGAMLGEKIAVTAKACAKEGMLAGRAEDKDGRGTRAQITKIHVPADADAEIAVIELDKSLGGARALITHMPLRDNYSVNAFAATDGKGFFSPDKGEASSIKGAILEEAGKFGTLLPAKGAEICNGDIGAPVCSSGATKIAGFDIRGTCGLSGLVIGKADRDAACNAGRREGMLERRMEGRPARSLCRLPQAVCAEGVRASRHRQADHPPLPVHARRSLGLQDRRQGREVHRRDRAALGDQGERRFEARREGLVRQPREERGPRRSRRHRAEGQADRGPLVRCEAAHGAQRHRVRSELRRRRHCRGRW